MSECDPGIQIQVTSVAMFKRGSHFMNKENLRSTDSSNTLVVMSDGQVATNRGKVLLKDPNAHGKHSQSWVW